MKFKYEEPWVKILLLDDGDVLTASPEDETTEEDYWTPFV